MTEIITILDTKNPVFKFHFHATRISFFGSCSWCCFFKKWAHPCLLLFIFVLFKHKIYRKTSKLQRDSNSDRQSRRRANWPLDHHHGPWYMTLLMTMLVLKLLLLFLMALLRLLMLVSFSNPSNKIDPFPAYFTCFRLHLFDSLG